VVNFSLPIPHSHRLLFSVSQGNWRARFSEFTLFSLPESVVYGTVSSSPSTIFFLDYPTLDQRGTSPHQHAVFFWLTPLLSFYPKAPKFAAFEAPCGQLTFFCSFFRGLVGFRSPPFFDLARPNKTPCNPEKKTCLNGKPFAPPLPLARFFSPPLSSKLLFYISLNPPLFLPPTPQRAGYTP